MITIARACFAPADSLGLALIAATLRRPRPPRQARARLRNSNKPRRYLFGPVAAARQFVR